VQVSPIRDELHGNQPPELCTKPAQEQAKFWLICAIFLIAGIVLIFTASGTADEGDSIMHYLYARSAFQYPAHFFYQWAKPVYVLLAAPFAQFGIFGIKFFNLLVSTTTLWITWKIARGLAIPHSSLAPLFLIAAPMMIIVTLSGLTEPLFACWLAAGVFGLVRKNYRFAIPWISFLPFLRSEGLIVLAVVFLFLIAKKKFKWIPWLLLGHVVYAIAGYPFYHDLLWVFNTLSYATLHSAYGSGPWDHFIREMPIVLSIPLCCLFVLGLVAGLVAALRLIVPRNSVQTSSELWLVYGICLAYIVAHSAFWALGIFNSFGLVRVMVGILPLISLISLRGFNLLTISFRLKWLGWATLATVLIFPILHNQYAFNWKRDFLLKADQQAEATLAVYAKEHLRSLKTSVLYFEPCYLSVVLDVDYFDTARHRRFLGAFESNDFPANSILIWDDWFAPMEGHVQLQQMASDPRFEKLATFEKKDFWNQTRTVVLFRNR
jgi:hypothetical protein